MTPKGGGTQRSPSVVVGDDKVMRERLGHADIGITSGRYTHVVTEQHRAAGERLDEVLGP